MHHGVSSDFVQYILAQENVALFQSLLQPLQMLGGYVGSVILFRLTKYPMSYVACCMIALHGTVIGGGALFTNERLVNGYVQAMTFVDSLLQQVLKVALQGMVADVIDYDRLKMGFDRSGTFVSVDRSVEGIFGILGEPLPQFTLVALGYKNNGGCLCGCGVHCKLPYLRWSCPSDIGYACSGAFHDNPLFFGDPSRRSACTLQPSAVVQSIRFFYFILPLVFYVTASILSLLFPVDSAVSHATIPRRNTVPACVTHVLRLKHRFVTKSRWASGLVMSMAAHTTLLRK